MTVEAMKVGHQDLSPRHVCFSECPEMIMSVATRTEPSWMLSQEGKIPANWWCHGHCRMLRKRSEGTVEIAFLLLASSSASASASSSTSSPTPAPLPQRHPHPLPPSPSTSSLPPPPHHHYHQHHFHQQHHHLLPHHHQHPYLQHHHDQLHQQPGSQCSIKSGSTTRLKCDEEKLMDNMADLNDEIADINEVCSCGCSLCAWAVVCFVRACVIVLREAISTTYAVPDGFDEAPIMGCLHRKGQRPLQKRS